MPSFRLAELSDKVGGTVLGDKTQLITGYASLFRASNSELACLSHQAQLPYLERSQAGAILISKSMVLEKKMTAVVVSNPIDAFHALSTLFDEPSRKPALIDSTASIASKVSIGRDVRIGPKAVIGEGVSIGNGTVIGSGVIIHPYVSVGNNVVLEAGVVLGAAPFNPEKSQGVWRDGQAFGTVIIEDNVTIGANSVVARGAHGDTLVGQGVKIDNLVQIAHDVIIGAHTVVAGCAAIGANTVIGKHCSVGGGSSIAGNLKIVDEVVITGMATVTRSINLADVYSSATTVQKHHLWRKNMARLHRLSSLAARLKRLA